MAGLLDMLGIPQQFQQAQPQMQPQPAPQPVPDQYNQLGQSVQQQFGLLKNIPFSVSQGQGPYQSEVYMPWNQENPTPNQFHVELRHYLDKPQSQEDLRRLITGETFHYLGTKKPNGEPVDPHWYNLKQQMIQTMSPHDLANAKRNWQEAQQNGDKRSFDDWMQESNMDQFIGGTMYPLSNEPEWVQRSKNLPHYAPKQAKVLEQMRQYLLTGQPPK